MDKIPSVPATIASMSRTCAGSIRKQTTQRDRLLRIHTEDVFFLTAFDKMEQAADKVQR